MLHKTSQRHSLGLPARLIAWLLATWCALAWSQPAEPPASPILRIDTGGVVALPRAAAVDPASQRVYSVGDDKAVRVWRQHDLRLLDTWRIPSGLGPEGQLNALALSPDGRHLAVGGWTGRTWDGVMSIYLFDTQNGQIVKRLSGIPPVIGALKFSPDGRFLAVGLVGSGGVFVVRWADEAMQFHDPDYQDSVLGLDMDAQRLAVVSMDGQLRTYDYRSGQRLFKRRLTQGSLPTRARLSPDGRFIAVGFHDAVRVAVLAADTGETVAQPNVAGIDQQRNLSLVAWSRDGSSLYAGGDPGESGASRLFRWQRMAMAQPASAVQVARQRLAAIEPMEDGSVLFLAEDPAIGRWDSQRPMTAAETGGVMDLRSAARALQVSGDANELVLEGGPGGARLSVDVAGLRVSLGRGATAPAADAGAALGAPLQWSPGEAAATWRGQALALKPYEFVRAVAATPDGEPLLATEYGVRLYDREGRLRWFTDVGGVAWGAKASADGRHVVAASSDGTVRWLRIRDGSIALSLFCHAGTREWVAWTPDGYYASSPRGDNLIGWQLNRGKLQRADFYLASQFERLLYRPDLVRVALRDAPATRGVTASNRFNIEDLSRIAPPRVDVDLLGGAGTAAQPGRVQLRLTASRTGARMLSYTVFVDDIPVTRSSERMLAAGEADGFVREISFTQHGGAGRIRVEVATEQAIGVRETLLPLPVAIAAARPPGRLYVMAVGVKRFAGLPERFNLDYTDRDAIELSRMLERQAASGLYSGVSVRLVSDGTPTAPTRANILAGLEFLKQAGPDDTVVLFLASHGLRDETGNYYFAVSDSRTEDLCAIVADAAAALPGICTASMAQRGDRSTFLSWQVFYDALAGVAGRRVLIVDTCEAGNIQGNSADLGTLRKRSASSRFALMLASGDGEASQEYPAQRHGLFTYALLRAMDGAAATGQPGAVTLERAFTFTQAEVERLRDRRLGTMTPVLDAPELLRSLALAMPKLPAPTR